MANSTNSSTQPKIGAIRAGLLPGSFRPCLHFHVSLDEEHVCLKIHDTRHVLDLGERSHHYALLILARMRLVDAQRQLDGHLQGWVDLDRLAKMLGLEPAHLNIQIFRMRKQLAEAQPAGAPVLEVIERRRGSLRFGDLPFHITRGSKFEADFDPPYLESQPGMAGSVTA